MPVTATRPARWVANRRTIRSMNCEEVTNVQQVIWLTIESVGGLTFQAAETSGGCALYRRW